MKKSLLFGCLVLALNVPLWAANPVVGITITLPANPDANTLQTVSEEALSKPVTFRWTPLVPRPSEPFTYRVRVWQLMPGQSGTQAMKANRPILMQDLKEGTEVTVPKLLNGPGKSPQPAEFVWNVQALNRDGKPIGENNGTGATGRFATRK